jgi:hypothetical protein
MFARKTRIYGIALHSIEEFFLPLRARVLVERDEEPQRAARIGEVNRPISDGPEPIGHLLQQSPRLSTPRITAKRIALRRASCRKDVRTEKK